VLLLCYVIHSFMDCAFCGRLLWLALGTFRALQVGKFRSSE